MVDPIGGPVAEQALRALGDRGRYLVIGFASGAIPSVPLNQVLLRNRTVLGIDWGIWSMQHAHEQRALLGDLVRMVDDGTLDPVHPTTYPLDRRGRGAGRPAGPPHRRARWRSSPSGLVAQSRSGVARSTHQRAKTTRATASTTKMAASMPWKAQNRLAGW